MKFTLSEVAWPDYVLSAIRDGNRHARTIRTAVRVMLRGRVLGVPGEPSDDDVYRPVDVAIQRLRREGKIHFTGLSEQHGWRLS